MNFSNAVKAFFSNYANFKGRAGRSEYWYAILFLIIGNIITTSIDNVIFSDNDLSPLNSLWSLAVVVPGIALVIRRLHDINKSGWNFFWFLIPIAGLILQIVWFIRESAGPNQWGQPAGTVAYPAQNGYQEVPQQPYNQQSYPAPGQQPYGQPQAPYQAPQQPGPYGTTPPSPFGQPGTFPKNDDQNPYQGK